MRRIALLLSGLVALLVLAASAVGQGEDDGTYSVRAYFDNAGFLVTGLDVRISGARVGSVQEVDVARIGEPVRENGDEDPGKAVAVLSIEDAGFQDFLSDASCMIRPQSLLGEKFVECEPTQPRAPGSPPPPPLEEIAEGEIGEGEYFLPLENNGKSVDLDLLNNVTRQPEAERFRLILNDLGAGLAARGEDLAEVIRRANPALEETDKVLAILAEQNEGLAQLAVDSDAILTPLARERQNLAGFIRNAAIAGTAAAERRDDIALGFERFPEALRELESTMVELRKFSEAGEPVAANLEQAAPDLAGATEALGPFAKASTPALTSLGRAAEASGENIAASQPVIRQLRVLGEATISPSKDLQALLKTFRKTRGIDYLMQFVLNFSNTFNGFDQYGHYLRTQLQITNCVEFVAVFDPAGGCGANWADGVSAAALSGPAPLPTKATMEGIVPEVTDGTFGAEESSKTPSNEGIEAPELNSDEEAADASLQGTRDLLQFLTGDGT